MTLHMTNSHVVPYVVWNQVNLDLAWKMPGAVEFQEKFSPATLRSETLGRKTGNHPMAMVTAGKGGRPDERSEEEYQRLKRTYEIGLLVHEVCWIPGISTRNLPQPISGFGYGTVEVNVINYREHGAPLSVSDGRCKWLLLRRDGQLMIVFATWNDEQEKIQVDVDTDALDVDVHRAVDTGSGETVKAPEGDFEFTMPGDGTRIYLLK